MIITKNIQTALTKATPKQLLDELVKQNPALLSEYVAENMPDKVIEIVMKDQRKPLGFEHLEYRFMDSNGKKYYGFHKDYPLSTPRFGKMRDFMMWMVQGVNPEEFEGIINTINKSWVETLKSGKNHARVGLLVEELRMRMRMTLHEDLLYQFMACQWIREDESPEKFDESIQNEKVAQFKKDTESGNTYFFFRQPELKQLSVLWNLSPEEWEAYWAESNQKIAWTKEALKTISYLIESDKEIQTLNQA